MKKHLMTMLLAVLTMTASAQEKSAKWYDNIKFSGYGMLQYQFEDKEGGEHNEFNLRLMRMMLDGKIGDFDWRAQIQGSNAKGPGEATVQLIDLYAEWVKHKEFRVKAGQFKRAFTFENPTNPVTQGWFAYAMAINALSAFGDRTGEKSSSGRDIGVQVQGDLFPNANGRRLLHYQVGVYNGEGINQKDKDQRKDIIGGLWVMPIQGVRIGAFGWTGSRADMTDMNGDKISMSKNRYALSAEYDKDQYTFRAEYLHSQGLGAEKVGSNIIDYAKGDKADGWYVFGIVPVVKSKLHAKARYQTYRDNKEWNRAKTMYEIGFNYFFTKNLQLNVEYARVNDRTIANPDKHNYNFVDAQFDFRF
ncbi:MAG: porin [Prevotella sp.]|nr:porin [Prevotella sp.]